MTLLWILLGILYVACWVYFGLSTFRQRALLDVLDRILPPLPLDHWRVDRPDSTCSRYGIAATAFVKYCRLLERSLDG